MLADPIRLAFRPPGRLDVPQPMDGGPALGPEEAIPIPGEITFDEVLAGLNPTETEGMIAVLRRIQERGIAILMVEHVMRVVMSLSDCIVVMHVGRKLAEGRPREIAENPEVIKAYLGDAPETFALSGAAP